MLRTKAISPGVAPTIRAAEARAASAVRSHCASFLIPFTTRSSRNACAARATSTLVGATPAKLK